MIFDFDSSLKKTQYFLQTNNIYIRDVCTSISFQKPINFSIATSFEFSILKKAIQVESFRLKKGPFLQTKMNITYFCDVHVFSKRVFMKAKYLSTQEHPAHQIKVIYFKAKEKLYYKAIFEKTSI